MKRALCLTILLALILLPAALGEAPRTVEPMSAVLDLSSLPDGIYPVGFDRSNLSVGMISHAHLFTVDSYDMTDIGLLAVGDVIVVSGQSVPVTRIERGEYVAINGGLEDGGFLLRAYESDHCFRVAQEDDFPTYTDRGEVTLLLSEGFTFADAWDIEAPPVLAVGADAVAEILASENEFFDPYSTTVTLEGGAVTCIERTYVP